MGAVIATRRRDVTRIRYADANRGILDPSLFPGLLAPGLSSMVRACVPPSIHPTEDPPVSGSPIRKEELAALEAMARGQSAQLPEEPIIDRLAKLGLIAQRGGKWSVTQRGLTDLERRKSLKRSSSRH
jgi:hypothetical protein